MGVNIGACARARPPGRFEGIMTMTASEFEGAVAGSPVVVVCDTTGKVLAVSTATADERFSSDAVTQKSIDDLFGQSSAVARWVRGELARADKDEGYFSETTLKEGAARTFVRLDLLERDGESFGFALQVYPDGALSGQSEPKEGDSVVTQKQWHEIKNHIGALKLYATFLTRRMQEGDERQTVEKMLNGINLLIDYIAKIRRGEMQ